MLEKTHSFFFWSCFLASIISKNFLFSSPACLTNNMHTIQDYILSSSTGELCPSLQRKRSGCFQCLKEKFNGTRLVLIFINETRSLLYYSTLSCLLKESAQIGFSGLLVMKSIFFP